MSKINDKTSNYYPPGGNRETPSKENIYQKKTLEEEITISLYKILKNDG